MAKICTNCGKENRDNMTFCADCGTKLPAAAPVGVNEFEADPTMRATPIQMKTAPAPAPAPVKEKTKVKKEKTEDSSDSKAPSTGIFLMYKIIFAVPIIGWVAALIMAFTAPDKAIKSYARATLIWVLVWLVVAIIIYNVVIGMVNNYISSLSETLNTTVEGNVSKAQYLFEMFSKILGGSYSITLG
ncbi:MAG: zinc ribbon domain-containing protein [Ruminococcaceae bacterium]|nr:zinc ribbon domain-containing protein [Oscillospiraceae bacterium]